MSAYEKTELSLPERVDEIEKFLQRQFGFDVKRFEREYYDKEWRDVKPKDVINERVRTKRVVSDDFTSMYYYKEIEGEWVETTKEEYMELRR